MPPASNIQSIVIKGVGAVSPAGWSSNDLIEQALDGTPLPHEELSLGGNNRILKVRQIPKPTERQEFDRHPRLRRASAISRFVTSAGLEALGDDRAEAVRNNELRLGIIVVFTTGCVTYTARFFNEVMDDSTLASPILFPETVFNAPASHLATILGSTGINYTLLGDGAEFLSGLNMASEWLITHQCDGCLIVGAEESNRLVSEAVHLFTPEAILAEGAGAIYLERGNHSTSKTTLISKITDPVIYTNDENRRTAAIKMRKQLKFGPEIESQAILLDGLQDISTLDEAEKTAWETWSGHRLSILKSLGNAMGASSAWQCVLAASLLEQKYEQCHSALVSGVGLNQQSIAAEFTLSTS